jgi:hypothetical protein
VAISFNTGTTAHAETAASVAPVIPAGVLVGDVMVLVVNAFTETGSTPTVAISGGGGAWTLVTPTTGTNPEVATAGASIWNYAWLYTRVATAGDPGATLTITETGSPAATTWLAVALAAYTGANTVSPVDVCFASNAQGTSTATAPSGSTVTAGDWAVHVLGCGVNGIPVTGPGTGRENVVSAALVGAVINDSNAPVGGAGTSIGGGTWTQSGNTSDWWSMFEVGLVPPSSGGGSSGTPPILSNATGDVYGWVWEKWPIRRAGV